MAGLTQRDHIPGNLLDALDGLQKRVAAVERTATTPTVIIGDAAALIATHASDAGAHHSPVTIGAGGLSAKLGVSAQSLTLADIAHAELAAIDANQHIDHTSVSILAGNGLTGGGTIAASRTLHLDTPGTLTASTTNSATGNHTHAITSAYDVTDPSPYSALLRSNNDGGITLAEMATMRVTSHLIPKLTDTYDLGTSTLLWRKGWLSELDTVLFAENTVTLLGGWFYVTKYAGTAQEDVDDSQTQIDLGVDDAALSAGDHIVFRQSLQMEYMTLGAYAGTNVWNVTRDVDGSGSNAWPEGAPFVVLGQSGDGRIELNAYDTPRISIIKQGVAYNAQTEMIRLGDLNGMADYTGEEYGVFIGDYAGGRWMAYDETHSLRIRGDALIEGTVDATKLSVGMRDQLFSRAGGLLLLNSDAEMTPASWTSLRGQVATISGAFHPVAGPWAGSRALSVERGTTNLVANPSFEVDVTGWTQAAGTRVRSTAQALFGSASMRITGAYSQAYTSISPSSTTVTASFWFKVVENTNGQLLGIRITDSGGSTLATAVIPVAQMDGNWHRVQVTYDGASAPGRVYARAVDANVGGTLEWYVDGVQAEEYPYATSYCDGDQGSGYSWSGTAHNSASVRASTWATLDDYAAAIDGLDTVTHSILVQARYDADDPDWPCNVSGYSNTAFVVDARGSSSANQVGVYYLPGTDALAVYLNGSYRITVPDQTFVAGDWLHIIVTLDYSSNSYHLYLNGQLIGSATDALSAPTGLATWKLGVPYHDNVNYYGGWSYAEYATMGTVLTPEQVAALYHRNAPLADAGALDTPGIYILDGRFRIASSTGDTRIEITPEEIAGYGGGDKQFWLQASDGKAYAGGGNVWLDVNGLSMVAAASDISDIKWYDSALQVARLRAYRVSSDSYLTMQAFAASSSQFGRIDLSAVGAGVNNATLRAVSATSGSGALITNVIGSTSVFDVELAGIRLNSGRYFDIAAYGTDTAPGAPSDSSTIRFFVRRTSSDNTQLVLKWSDGHELALAGWYAP